MRPVDEARDAFMEAVRDIQRLANLGMNSLPSAYARAGELLTKALDEEHWVEIALGRALCPEAPCKTDGFEREMRSWEMRCPEHGWVRYELVKPHKPW